MVWGSGSTLVIGIDLLIYIECLPVRLPVPYTRGIIRRRAPVSMVKTWDEVRPTDDVVGVKETKGSIFKTWDELDSIQPFGFPAGSVCFINLEPADPKDIHFGLICHLWSMENTEPVDPKDLRIGVRMNPIAGECHHM